MQPRKGRRWRVSRLGRAQEQGDSTSVRPARSLMHAMAVAQGTEERGPQNPTVSTSRPRHRVPGGKESPQDWPQTLPSLAKGEGHMHSAGQGEGATPNSTTTRHIWQAPFRLSRFPACSLCGLHPEPLCSWAETACAADSLHQSCAPSMAGRVQRGSLLTDRPRPCPGHHSPPLLRQVNNCCCF